MALSDGGLAAILIVFSIILLLGIIFVAVSIKIVNHAEVMILER